MRLLDEARQTATMAQIKASTAINAVAWQYVRRRYPQIGGPSLLQYHLIAFF